LDEGKDGPIEDSSDIPHLDIYYLNRKVHNQENKMNFLEVSSKEKLFTPDTEYVKRINDPKNKSLWQAAIYKDFVGKPYSEMRGLLGGFRSMKDFGQSDNNNDAFLELENTVSETYNK